METDEKGVNYVDFYPSADKPYLVTAGDDKTVEVWDYLSESCVQTMEGRLLRCLPSQSTHHRQLVEYALS